MNRSAFIREYLLEEYGFLSQTAVDDLDALIDCERADERRRVLEEARVSRCEYRGFSSCSCGDDIACESCVSFWAILSK